MFYLIYEERLWIFRLEKTGLREDLIHVYQYLTGGCREDGERVLSVGPNERTKSNKHKLKYRKSHFYTTEIIVTVRVVKYWNRLSREVTEFVYGVSFQNLPRHSSSLRCLRPWSSRSSFQPLSLCDSVMISYFTSINNIWKYIYILKKKKSHCIFFFWKINVPFSSWNVNKRLDITGYGIFI